jgi:membrane fusion protein, multidrug efflux system
MIDAQPPKDLRPRMASHARTPTVSLMDSSLTVSSLTVASASRPARPLRAAILPLLTVLAAASLTACGGGEPAGVPGGGGGAGGGMAGGGPGGPGGAPGGGRATPVSLQIARPGDLEVTLRASSNLRAREQVDVLPRQGGVVAAILVEEGSRVQEGAVLARLDATEWRLQAEQAEARAQASREAVTRARALAQLDLISEQEVERLVSESRVTEAEVGLARLRVENAEIRAPISGVVTHRYIERGAQIGTAAPAFAIADLDRLEAHLAVPERDVSRVTTGQLARILLQEGAEPVAAGRVERIRPVVDPASGTVQVTVSVPASAGGVMLRPGQFVNVDLVTEVLSDRITLPRTAVLVDGAAPRVYVVRGGVGVEREVQLGFSRGDRVEIRSGVVAGDSVVVVGQDSLRPDTPVRIMFVDGVPVVGGATPANGGDPE